MAHSRRNLFCDLDTKLYSMRNSSINIDVQVQFEKELNLRFIGETLECQMIQVFRQIENNQCSVFNTISKGKEGKD